MNKKSEQTDKSAPYRTCGLGKIAAPVTPKGEPKSTKTKGTGDLRGGKNK